MKKKNPKPSKVEAAKAASNELRGTVREVLEGDAAAFEHDDIQVLKFHGIYQQDDRDQRVARKKAGKDKLYSFMVRAKIPGGELSAEQYLALDDLATEYSEDGSVRLTSRQAIQFHGILKGDLRRTLQGMNEALISTLAACGDVERNVMVSPSPVASPVYESLRQLAREISADLCPQTGAYHDIWLDGEKLPREKLRQNLGEESSGESASSAEPFYGPQYLPRKLKTAIALPEDASVDLHSQDIGLLGVVVEGELLGVNLLAGGGLGMTHRKADTFARLGTPLGFVPLAKAVAATRAVAAVFRDHGNRSDRRHARLKYLIEEWGQEPFREAVEAELGSAFEPWMETPDLRYEDHLGTHRQGDGFFFRGIFVENGRISNPADGAPGLPLKAVLRQAVAELRPRVLLTPSQNILLANLSQEQVQRLEELLREHRVAGAAELSPFRRFAMACPALPTCGLALADAERHLPKIIDRLEAELAEVVGDTPLTVRMTGCPNGCARPYTADLGFVGRGPGIYDIYVGGGLTGDRLGDLYEERVKDAEILPTLRPLLDAWITDRSPDEGLGDFYQRNFGDGAPRTLLTGSKENPVRQRIAAVPV